METEFYQGKIKGEKWRESLFHPDYWISNYGRVFSFKSDRYLVPNLQKNTLIYGIDGESYSVRTLLLTVYRPEEIIYDYGIPPKKVLIEKIKSGKIGVYPAKSGFKPWRFVIQWKNDYFSRSFKTKEEAREGWIKKYCWLYDLNYEEVMREISC